MTFSVTVLSAASAKLGMPIVAARASTATIVFMEIS
jgi:hypothetical protein